MHEVDEAESQPGVLVRSAMSDEYVQEMERRVQLFFDQGFRRAQDCLDGAGICVRTIQAKCGNQADEQMLVQLIQQKVSTRIAS